MEEAGCHDDEILVRESNAKRNWEIFSVIFSISMVGLATGLTLPLVSLRLNSANAPAGMIALMAALPALGTILIAPAVGRMSRRFTSKSLVMTSTLVCCVSMAALTFPFEPNSWALARLSMGMGTGVLIALGEARILELSNEDARGRWTGLYTTAFTACQVAGPALLALLGSDGSAAIWLAVSLYLLSSLLIAGTRSVRATIDRASPLSIIELIGRTPAIAAGVLFFSIFDSALLSLLPIYGLEIGLSETIAMLMVTVVFLGDALLQLAIGWGTDKWGRRTLHRTCGVITLVSLASLPVLTQTTIALWPVLFLLGAAAGGIYTIALVRIGDQYSGARLVGANALAGLLWGVGSLIGPLLGGAALATYRPHGLVWLLALLAAVFLVSERRTP